MSGKNIYFTDQELNMIIEYIHEAKSILGEAEDTWEKVEKDMNDGLGSALRKLYKGRNGGKILFSIQN